MERIKCFILQANGRFFFMIVLSNIAAVANGLTRQLMILIYGDLLDALSTTDQENMVKGVLKVRVLDS